MSTDSENNSISDSEIDGNQSQEIKTPMCNMNPLQRLYCGMLFSNVGNEDAHVQYEPTTVFILWHVIF